jgi:hypothetical protein
MGKLPRLIGRRDDVYAAVGHRLTHLVLHAGPLGEELRENHAGGLYVLEREARGADVYGRLARVERHHDGQVPRAIEPEVGGDESQLLSGGGISGDSKALAHDAGLGAVLFQGYVFCCFWTDGAVWMQPTKNITTANTVTNRTGSLSYGPLYRNTASCFPLMYHGYQGRPVFFSYG